jgi:hypothetical protein
MLVGTTIFSAHAFQSTNISDINPQNDSSKISKYAGEEKRKIKSLSEQDIETLQKGTGGVFGGLATLAELNGYPGPRHVLDIETDLQLSEQQKNEINSIYMDMNANAKRIGNALINVEEQIDTLFVNKSITNSTLYQLLEESASIYGELRYVHLNAHLETMKILSPKQIALYNELRGYSSGDPCTKIPAGHDPELWKLHHGCK